MHSRIVQSEKENDDRRDYKLKRLINPSNNYNDPNIEVFNYSSQDIPENILSILKRGIFNGVGGYNKKTAVLAKFNSFFSSWKKHAEKKNINFFKINKIRSQIFLEFEKFCNSTTKTEDSKILKEYLDENPQILVCPVDKSKNLDIFDFTDYTKKLDEIFEPTKFKKINHNPINVDLHSFKTIINEFK